MANRNEIAKSILYGLGLLGLLAVAVVAPNVVEVIGKELGLYKKFSRRQIMRTTSNLKKNGLIYIKQEAGKTVIKLTKEGQEKLFKFKLEDLAIKPQKKWDKKWRLVIFDVPVNFNYNRSVFTVKLKELGFKLLQKSIWICPYPCEDEIDFIKKIYEIGSYVRVVTADKIDIQNDLMKIFNLDK